ncbi:energy-coupling factor transporter transmembrane component T, partial [Staphylococcus aureus]
ASSAASEEYKRQEISSGNIATRIKSFIPLLVPLFISAFQRAEELAVAMEVRGYDANVKRTSYRQLKWQLRDTLYLIMII